MICCDFLFCFILSRSEGQYRNSGSRGTSSSDNHTNMGEPTLVPINTGKSSRFPDSSPGIPRPSVEEVELLVYSTRDWSLSRQHDYSGWVSHITISRGQAVLNNELLQVYSVSNIAPYGKSSSRAAPLLVCRLLQGMFNKRPPAPFGMECGDSAVFHQTEYERSVSEDGGSASTEHYQPGIWPNSTGHAFSTVLTWGCTVSDPRIN